MLKIGPSGNSADFYSQGGKHTYQAAKWLKEKELTAFEYSFGQGVKISEGTAQKIKNEFDACGIEISAHAPYYINFANEDPEMIEKSVGYILNSLLAVHAMGGKRVVFHPASCGKLTREKAVELTKQNIKAMAERIEASVNFDYKLCVETMGKLQQIGRVEEVLEFCNLNEKLYPCFDFGHINSYTHGGLKTKEDYRKIIEASFSTIGEEKTKNMHIHFSKIMFGKGGEVKHLTFDDEVYGPEYQPLAELIDEYSLTPFIICESAEVMARDAITMKKMHKNI